MALDNRFHTLCTRSIGRCRTDCRVQRDADGDVFRFRRPQRVDGRFDEQLNRSRLHRQLKRLDNATDREGLRSLRLRQTAAFDRFDGASMLRGVELAAGEQMRPAEDRIERRKARGTASPGIRPSRVRRFSLPRLIVGGAAIHRVLRQIVHVVTETAGDDHADAMPPAAIPGARTASRRVRFPKRCSESADRRKRRHDQSPELRSHLPKTSKSAIVWPGQLDRAHELARVLENSRNGWERYPCGCAG
jgi:hypothetical protein